MTIRPPFLPCILLAAVLSGCATDNQRAPVTEHGGATAKTALAPVMPGQTAREGDWRPQVYVVQKGDTLYGIAFNYGLDYHDVAALNSIQNPDMIQTGQELRLFPPGAVVAGKFVPAPKPEEVKLAAAAVKPAGVPVASQPQVAKLPYSESAVAQIEKMQSTALPQAVSAPLPTQPGLQEPKPVVAKPPEPAPVVIAVSPAVDGDDIAWGMPADGKLISGFSETENRKGMDFAGKMGQPVLASAAGKVVYSGSGLRGYGKLIIIKHNNTYLSAYAHNSQILVKEGQTVTKGQKIAEMGDSDADQVKLHFEIRKLGKPVDPAKYLPKS